MNCEEAKEQWMDLLANHATGAELDAFLLQHPACREELEPTRQVWQQMSFIELPEPSQQMRTGFYAMLRDYKAPTEPTPEHAWNELAFKLRALLTPKYVLGFAFSCLLFAAGFTTGFWLNNKTPSGTGYQTEISSLSAEVQEMRQIVLLSLIENPSATERLKAVGYTRDISTANDKVVQALLNTLNNDPNVNVRLVTVEALAELAAVNPKVREGLVQSLTRQESPIVQSAMVDVMVKLQEKRSVQKLRQLLKEDNINQLVKDKIEKGIEALS